VIAVLVVSLGLLVAWAVPAVADSPLTWSAPVTIDGSAFVYGVSCPAASLCVAGTNTGDLVTSSEPTSGAGGWTPANITKTFGFAGVSCVSTALCVALDGGGEIVTATEPTGGAGAWSSANITEGAGGPRTVSCPSPSL